MGFICFQCRIKNISEYKLLAGPVNVVLDNDYVAKVDIDVSYHYPCFFPAYAKCIIDYQHVSPGDTFTCMLGDDPAVHLSYHRTAHVVPSTAGLLGRFAGGFHTTTVLTSEIVLWNKHEQPIGEVIVKDIIPVPEEKSFVAHNCAQVVLRKPEGLADVREGTEVEVGIEVLHSWDGKAKGKRRMDVNVKGDDCEGEYVEVEAKEKEEKVDEMVKAKKRAKVMWEKSVDGVGGEKEGRFEWIIKEMDARAKVRLETEWEVKADPSIRWQELPTFHD